RASHRTTRSSACLAPLRRAAAAGAVDHRPPPGHRGAERRGHRDQRAPAPPSPAPPPPRAFFVPAGRLSRPHCGVGALHFPTDLPLDDRKRDPTGRPRSAKDRRLARADQVVRMTAAGAQIWPWPLHRRIAKRALDVAVSSAALIVASPLLLLIAAAIKLTSPGPVLFRQPRVGRGGRSFAIWKFRTMVEGAQHRGPAITASGDPRVTPVWRLLPPP